MASLTQIVEVTVGAGGTGSAQFGLHGDLRAVSWVPPAGAIFTWNITDAQGFPMDSGDSAPNSTRIFPSVLSYKGNDYTLAITGGSVPGVYKAKLFAKYEGRDA